MKNVTATPSPTVSPTDPPATAPPVKYDDFDLGGHIASVLTKRAYNSQDPKRHAAAAATRRLHRRLRPIGPLEEMLSTQLIIHHARIAHLAATVASARTLDECKTYNLLLDSASETYRRLVLLMEEYRNGGKKTSSFTAIKQANITQQQFVAAPAPSRKKTKQLNHGQPLLQETEKKVLQPITLNEEETTAIDPEK